MSDASVVEVVPHDKILLIAIRARSLDDAKTPLFIDGVLNAASQRPGVPIVIDMSAVRFAPSVALGAFVQLSKSLKMEGRRIGLFGVERRVFNTMSVTQLNKILEIRDTLEQFLAGPPPS
jgi:anti-anti-sigma factor